MTGAPLGPSEKSSSMQTVALQTSLPFPWRFLSEKELEPAYYGPGESTGAPDPGPGFAQDLVARLAPQL